MGDGLLSLAWNNHKATFYHIISTLREKEKYTDVTLACEGKFYPVHKLVLSTCSEYFENIFEHTPCKHPVIVLKDIRSDEVEALLSYMYAGIVNVAQSDLARLIKAAELLQVKGLAVPDEPPQSQEVENRKSATPRTNSRNERTSPNPKRRRRDSETPQRESQKSVTPPPASPRLSPYSAPNDFQHEGTRASGESQASNDHRQPEPSERLELRPELGSESDAELKSDLLPTTSASSVVPHVMVDESLVKEEVVEPVNDSQDMLIGMDYGSNSGTDKNESGMLDHHNQVMPNKYEPSLLLSQPQHLTEAVVDALAGPSGMQGWLGGGDPGGGFSGVDSYVRDGRHQELRASLPTQPQQHPTMMMRQQGVRGSRGAPAVAKVRTTKKLHQCQYCPYNSYFNTNFKRHVSTHTGEKPYGCPFCPYRSNSNDHLKRHVNVHTGHQPYQCDKCPFKSARKEKMVFHYSTHTD